MDYYKIGQQIRKYRKAHGLSQEQLAELVGISVPHMSHIETGNTKLSLPVFVSLANALGVQTDDLLCQTPSGRTIACQEMAELVERCSTQQLRIITDIAKAAKISLDKYEHQTNLMKKCERISGETLSHFCRSVRLNEQPNLIHHKGQHPSGGHLEQDGQARPLPASGLLVDGG